MTRRGAAGEPTPPHRDDDDAEPVGDFGDAVLALVADIPPGLVLTYGDVAALLGTRAARAVGTILARSGGTVPWWRVIRASGLPPAGHAEAALLNYEAEGTPLRPYEGPEGYRVDLRAARWRP
ncbi:MGMT family protein [Agromyces seonyuensis]|uniref:DNA-binding protein n=1 Tax=Agromyces seonyuensis TaxID=2662446 RepID=A0A6I4NWZ2_9MICO|nr:MGMT family protein [Agromyces seonyuensis]MWB98798.1 DNA-binding protein [Agromyces seonyuensis]